MVRDDKILGPGALFAVWLVVVGILLAASLPGVLGQIGACLMGWLWVLLVGSAGSVLGLGLGSALAGRRRVDAGWEAYQAGYEDGREVERERLGVRQAKRLPAGRRRAAVVH